MFIFAGIFGMLMAGAALVSLQDLLEPEAAPDEPEADEILIGSEDDDTFFAGLGDDQIGGYSGDDTAEAGAGDDAVDGMEGDDDLSGGAGNDTLSGQDGSDDLFGDDDDDHLMGGFGADSLSGGAGNDLLEGGADDDLLMGEAGHDALHGNYGDDSLDGGSGEDTLMGGAGDDLLSGTADTERDFLNGGSGNDTLLGGATDVLSGGDGADVFAMRADLSQPIHVMDYSDAEDSLVIVTDNAVGLQTLISEDGTVVLTADGQELARFPAGTELGKITVLSMADAAEFFDDEVPLSFSGISK